MPDDAPDFASLGLREELLQTLREVGYETPTPIQAATIPPLLAGRDVVRSGPDGHRQDRGLRAAGPGPASTSTRKAAGAGPGPTRELIAGL